MSGECQSLLTNSLKKMTLTIFLSVHWGAPQEQTSARITEPLCKHHQSLSLVWMILNSKCDHCRESWYSEEELNAHIESVHKDPTTSPGWSLPWIEISWEWKRPLKETRNWLHCYRHDHPFGEDPCCQHCHSCQNFVQFVQRKSTLNWFQPRGRKKRG